MGTSASSSGQGNSTPLVPSWLGGPEQLSPSQPAVAGSPTSAPPTVPAGAPQLPNTGVPVVSAPVSLGRFQQARVNFSRFAGSGGSDRRALGRAVRSYVSRANGGAANATRRMGSSRRSAANIINVFGQLARDGTANTFRAHNLDAALTSDPGAALLALTDLICGDGGTIDEAIARDAWCEVIATIDALGIVNLDQLNHAQRQQIFADFIAKTVELRILNDIGAKGFTIAGSPSEIRRIHEELADYIQTATRDQVAACFPSNLESVSTARAEIIGTEVYEIAWSILETYQAPRNAAP
jgi:hypothetical protein